MPELDSFAKPASLPECWWVEAEYENGEVWLSVPSETRAAAEMELEREKESATNWIRKPRNHVVSLETFDRRVAQRFVYGVSHPALVTARWNWIERNRELLDTVKPRACCALASLGGAADPDPRIHLRNKVGGLALLPRNARWPCIAHQAWSDFTWHSRTMIAKELGLTPASHRFRGGLRPATYLATYDLRGRFDFGRSFPAGVSIFVSTYDEEDDNYSRDYASSLQTVGVAVPIFNSDELELRDPPDGVPILHEESLQPWDIPDFPCCGEAEELHEKLESIEPGTASWINLDGKKIGGYPGFRQQSLLEQRNRASLDMEWHWIGCFEGAISFGDSGTLYLLAGRNRFFGKWQWHVEWQCG